MKTQTERDARRPVQRLVRQITLRDFFAASALQGLCASQTIMEYIADRGVVENRPGAALTTLPQRAYRLADAMLAQRRILPNDQIRRVAD